MSVSAAPLAALARRTAPGSGAQWRGGHARAIHTASRGWVGGYSQRRGRWVGVVPRRPCLPIACTCSDLIVWPCLLKASNCGAIFAHRWHHVYCAKMQLGHTPQQAATARFHPLTRTKLGNMAAQGMMLRGMHLVGGTQRRVELPPQHRPVFEEGAALIFTRWTALQLGVHNEWGGSKSALKGQELLQDVIGWFYNTKGAGWTGMHAHMPAPPPPPPPPPAATAAAAAILCRVAPGTHHIARIPAVVAAAADHEMCDLQELLDEALQLDFNIQAEDDSPYQVGGRVRRQAEHSAGSGQGTAAAPDGWRAG